MMSVDFDSCVCSSFIPSADICGTSVSGSGLGSEDTMVSKIDRYSLPSVSLQSEKQWDF